MRTKTTKSPTSSTTTSPTFAGLSALGHTEEGCESFLALLQRNFKFQVGEGFFPLFTTDATGLFDLFLSGLKSGPLRQHYNCNSCRRFVETYGGLVCIGPTGETIPIMWNFTAEGIYERPVRFLREEVAAAKVTGVFLSKNTSWGERYAGGWTHMSVTPPSCMVYVNPLLTAGQKMAEKREEFDMLQRALVDFPVTVVDQALPLLESETLYRGEKVLGVAKWFRGVHDTVADTRSSKARSNVIWRAVDYAPAGWCHIRSSMIGSLLDDIASGMAMATVKLRFGSKMNPLQYQRPQAPPKEGTIKRANEIFEKLGLAEALKRRYATLCDVRDSGNLLWEPKPPKKTKPRTTSAGTFSHLSGTSGRSKRYNVPNDGGSVPIQNITWEKFARTVLPKAEEISYFVPNEGPFIALVTATNPKAPPVLQWDRLSERNPVSHYVYPSRSPARWWGLPAYTHVKVTGLCLFPHQWNDNEQENHAKGAIAILEGVTISHEAGLALFPECLRADLHEVRSVIEAHSRSAKISGKGSASACGVDLRTWEVVLRVKTGTSVIDYKIDRRD